MKKTILAIIIALIGSSNLFAQNGGAIRGVVTDENGAKVSGAHVVLNLVPGIQLTTQTNESGVFEYKGLRAGLYLIEVKADGFSEFTSESIRLDRGETKAVAVQLKVAAINASVVVSATGTPMKFGFDAMYHRLKDTETDFMSFSARVMWPLNLSK